MQERCDRISDAVNNCGVDSLMDDLLSVGTYYGFHSGTIQLRKYYY